MGGMTETQVQDDDAALYAAGDDTPSDARIRRSLVRLFATTPVFMQQPASEYPHLAADTAMRIFTPVLAAVRTETRQEYAVAVREAADARITGRLAVIEAAARASERAACIAELRDEAKDLAAAALEASGPDAAVAARDSVAMAAAAQRLTSDPASER